MGPGELDHTPRRSSDTGTFTGHLGPGCFYIIFGCLWAHNALFRYHVARRQAVLRGNDGKKLCYKNALFAKYHSGWAHAAPVEAITLVVVGIIFCIGEHISYQKGMPLIVPVHHVTIYISAGCIGAVEIFRHYKYAMPPSSEYAMFVITTSIIAFLFSNHIFSKEMVNRQMHTMLVYFNVIIGLFTALELTHRRNVTLALGRILTMIVQGFWFVAIAFIDYPLPSLHAFDLNDHALLEAVAVLGIVVVFVALIIALTMNVIITRRVRTMNLATVNRIVALTHYQRAPSGSKDEAGRPLISDSDYEI